MDCRRVAYCLLPFALVAMIGCGNGNLGKVSGVVTMDGNPVPNVTLEFIPQEGGRPSIAKTDANGEYSAYYTHDQPGVELGQHHVRFQILADVGQVSEEEEFSPPSRQEGGGTDIGAGRKLSPEVIDVKSGQNNQDFQLIEK